MKVWIVYQQDIEEYTLQDIYSSEARAKEECQKLNDKKSKYKDYFIEELEVKE